MPKPDKIAVRASYMGHVHQTQKSINAQARAVLGGTEFDTMVGTGLSGALIIPSLARSMRKNWLIIRKKGDSTHSARPAEGHLGERWLFVDDLIDTGATLTRVENAVARLVSDENQRRKRRNQWREGKGKLEPVFASEYVGAYLYEDGVFETP